MSQGTGELCAAQTSSELSKAAQTGSEPSAWAQISSECSSPVTQPLTVSTPLPSTVSTVEHVCPVRYLVITIIEATCCLCFHLPLEKESLCRLMEQPIVRFPRQSRPEKILPKI